MPWVEKAQLAIATDPVVAEYIGTEGTEARAAVKSAVKPLVAQSLAESDVPAQAAKAAVSSELASSRVARFAPQAGPAVELTLTGAASDGFLKAAQMGESSPYAWLLSTDADEVLLSFGAKDGLADLALSDWSIGIIADRIGGATAKWDGGTTEWWTNMVVEDKANNRVLIACMDHDGWHYVLEARPGAPVRGVQIVQTVADDHNLGGLLILPDGSLTYVYNKHNQTYSLEAILGDPDGSVDSLARNPIAVLPGGGRVSYNQLVLREKASTRAKAEVYAGIRREVEAWGMIPISYDLVARTITSSAYLEFFSSPGQQCYTHIGPSFTNAAGQQCVPLVTGYNPEKVRRVKPDYYRYTLNVETGEITYANDATKGRLGDGRSYADFTPAITGVPDPDTWGRRLFYGTRDALLYAEGPLATPDDWTYYAALFKPDGTYTRHAFGRAGKRFGNRVDSNYLNGMGMRFGSNGTEICLGRELNGMHTLESFKLQRDGTWKQTLLYGPAARPAIRPYWAGALGWLYNEVIDYPADGYIGAHTNLRTVQEGAQ